MCTGSLTGKSHNSLRRDGAILGGPTGEACSCSLGLAAHGAHHILRTPDPNIALGSRGPRSSPNSGKAGAPLSTDRRPWRTIVHSAPFVEEAAAPSRPDVRVHDSGHARQQGNRRRGGSSLLGGLCVQRDRTTVSAVAAAAPAQRETHWGEWAPGSPRWSGPGRRWSPGRGPGWCRPARCPRHRRLRAVRRQPAGGHLANAGARLRQRAGLVGGLGGQGGSDGFVEGGWAGQPHRRHASTSAKPSRKRVVSMVSIASSCNYGYTSRVRRRMSPP